MKYSVVIEKDKGHYRAFVPAIPNCVAEGGTRADTLDKIRKAIVDRLSKIEITTIEVEPPPAADPWEPFIGMWKDDPTWEEFQMEIAAYRQKADDEEGNA